MQRLLEPGNYSNSCQTKSLLIYNEVSKRVIKRTWEVVKCQGSINGGKSSGDSRFKTRSSCVILKRKIIYFWGGDANVPENLTFISCQVIKTKLLR